MKGVVYLIEVSFAIFIFAFSIWVSLSTIDIKLHRDMHELISIAQGFSHILNSYDINMLIDNTTFFINMTDYIIPKNIYWGVEIEGVPKQIIELGCANCTGKQVVFLRNILTPVYYNNRFVNFSVSRVNFTSLDKVLEFDTLIFINFTDFDNNNLIQEYLKKGGKIIAITDITTNTELENMDDTFSLSSSGVRRDVSYSKFKDYLISPPYIQKYFIGTGFRVEAKNSVDSKKQGIWKIWLNEKEVNITDSLEVEIQGIGKLKEGDVFVLNAERENNNLPNIDYYFRIKKVFPEEVYIQPLNTSFVFPQSIESNEIKVKTENGKNVIVSKHGSEIYSSVVVNTTTSRAVWISYFPKSSEFELLLKSIILAINNKFTLKEFYGETGIAIPFYASTCCDIPEVLKITLYLGYKY